MTAGSVGSWYQTLKSPRSTRPPNRASHRSTVLYLMIATSGWRAWRRRGLAGARAPMSAYALLLVLNLGWSFLFFDGRMIRVALAEVVLLLAAIVLNAVLFWRVERAAVLLLVPNAVWVGLAVALNAVLWRLN